jgi:hypothetical protein
MLKRILFIIKKLCLKQGYIYYISSYLNNSYYDSNSKFNKFLSHLNINSNLFNFQNPFIFSNNNLNIKKNLINQIDSNLIFLSSNTNIRNIIHILNQKRKLLSFNMFHYQHYSDFNTIPFLIKPEILFIFNINQHTCLLKEAFKFQIPIIGLLNSNTNSYGIHYPLPGNSSKLTQSLYTELLINTIINSKQSDIKFFL